MNRIIGVLTVEQRTDTTPFYADLLRKFAKLVRFLHMIFQFQ